MSTTGIDSSDKEYENQLSEIIQGELINLYGGDGYNSIMQTMVKISGRREEEIITNYDLFAELTEGVFGRLAESKILGPIKLEMLKIGEENIQQKQTPEKKSLKLLIADDEPAILTLYKTFLEGKGKEITTATDGKKCVDIYKRTSNESENCFDVVILDQKMPFMTGLEAAIEILNINPRQKIIFASGYLEKTLLEVLTKIDRAIAVIEKPFSLDVLDHMINNTELFNKLDKININQEEKDIKTKLSEIMVVLENQI
ncbi:response regulator [Nitrosopumilus oxyclinae]|uniref:Response regulator n=1 Tax=Nitrosopumilus oxyclinae TaxID=1959104 RepID=A0A7D5M1U9_9ARCH|nr:response regulator [Nitrosopumilus oxyclinae]QLH04612.1 response regulator [Nitrosopumilus oxyclinae]